MIRNARFSIGQGCQGLLRSVRFLKCEATVAALAFHNCSYAQFPWPSLPSSRCLCAARACRTLTFTAECRTPLNTCKALGGSRTSNSMHSCIAGRGARVKWIPAGRKDVGYEICSFYLARRQQWRANGTARLKSFAEKGTNIKLNHRNGTHSSHSNCPLYCGTPSGLFHLESHSSFKVPCANTVIAWKRDTKHGHLETINGSTWGHCSVICLVALDNFYCFLQHLIPIIK